MVVSVYTYLMCICLYIYIFIYVYINFKWFTNDYLCMQVEVLALNSANRLTHRYGTQIIARVLDSFVLSKRESEREVLKFFRRDGSST